MLKDHCICLQICNNFLFKKNLIINLGNTLVIIVNKLVLKIMI
jgi:hypothetical protein